MATAGKIQIELVYSVIATPRWMRRVVQAMGLRKLHSKVVVPDNPAMRGMIAKVPHLVKVTEYKE